MKVKLDIEFCDCDDDLNGSASGEVIFDEFGVVKKVRVNSSSLGKADKGKKKVKKLLKRSAQSVRAEIINK
jgi:hypothetical protein